MKKLIPLLILLSTSAHAHNWFTYPLLGNWQQTDPRFGTQIRVLPTHLIFDDCGPLELISYQYKDWEFEENELSQRNFDIHLTSHNNLRRGCFNRGYHYCEAKVNQWGRDAEVRFLMIQCDNWQFMRVYQQRLR